MRLERPPPPLLPPPPTPPLIPPEKAPPPPPPPWGCGPEACRVGYNLAAEEEKDTHYSTVISEAIYGVSVVTAWRITFNLKLKFGNHFLAKS